MSLKGIRARVKMVTKIRQCLIELGFEEIAPKVFSKKILTEPTIYPFRTEDQVWFLQTSPEYYLKKAIAQGIGNCFMISPAFRNMEGEGRWHQPEFLMVEWYQKDFDWKDQMVFTQKLIEGVLNLSHKKWPVLSWEDLWQNFIKLDLRHICECDSLEWAQERGYQINQANWEQIFNQVGDNEIVKCCPKTPFFMVDYPSRISTYAKHRIDKPWLAERFELYLEGIEIANGNTEKTAQKWAGVGLGIDRLVALNEGVSVREVQEF